MIGLLAKRTAYSASEKEPEGDGPALSVALTIAGIAVTAGAFMLYSRVAWPWLLLGWVGFVPWLTALDRTTTIGGAIGSGLFMSVAFVAALFPWIPAAISDYTGAPHWVGVVVGLVLAPILEPQLIAYAVSRQFARHARGGERWWRTAIVGAGFYVGSEWLWPKLLADTLGQGLHASALLRQAADLAGAHGLTFALIFTNECAFAALRKISLHPRLEKNEGLATGAWMAPFLCSAVLVAALLAYGSVRLSQLGSGAPAYGIKAAIVQADLSHYDRLAAEIGTFAAVREILDVHFSLSGEALAHSDLDVLIWPETVYPTTFGSPKSEDGAAFDREIGAFVGSKRTPLLFGAYDRDEGHEYNAAILLEPSANGRVSFDTYRKAQLFPFTEHLPSLLESERIRRWLPWTGHWTPGGQARTLLLTLRDGRRLPIAPLICYDALDPGFVLAAVREGAELLVTLSNDSWFAFPGMQRLILIASAFRSIEARRPQLRATTTGISAVIDASGELRDTLDVDGRGVLVGSIAPRRSPWTLMLAWGNWFPPTVLVGALALLVVSVITDK